MLTEKNPQIVIRLATMAGELLILNLLIWAFVSLNIVPPYASVPNGTLRLHLILTLCYALCSKHIGIVLHRRFVRAHEILWRVVRTSLYFALLSTAVLFVIKSPAINLKFLIGLFVCQIFLNIALAWLAIYIIKRVRSTRSIRKNALFVGPIDSMLELIQSMDKDLTTGYKMLGFFDDINNIPQEQSPYYRGSLNEVKTYLAEHYNEIDELYCTLSSEQIDQIKDLIRFTENHLIRFIGVPTTYNFIRHRVNTITIADAPAFTLRRAPLESLDCRFAKRTFDLLCSILFLVFVFPILYIVLGTLIKLSSPGPVLFKQKRSGLNGKEFYCYKFRSMKVNVNADELQATQDDPRKTRIGNFMRRTNIDEFPQFINVFKGDMSMVGPRPHMLKHTEEYRQLIDKYMVRHFVRPGITGWAQVTGFRGETKELWQMEGRVKQDIWYIENWTFMLDLWIIFRTFIKTGDKKAY